MPAMFDLSGRVAIVTGANTGLGQAMALALAGAGADVALVGRSPMNDIAARIAALGRESIPIKADLSTIAPIAEIVERTCDWRQRIDILVNNAGIIRRADAIEFTEDDWDAVMDVNLKSVFFLSQAVAKRMLSRGSRDKIINIASVLSFQGGIRVPSYTAAKSRSGRADAASRLRMGDQGNQRQRDRAGIFRDRQHHRPARRQGSQRRDPGADSCWTLGQARGDRRSRGISGVGGGRLRPWRGPAGRWGLAGEMNELKVAERFEDDSPQSTSEKCRW
jgi:NADP-dependent 3-hydroxy acid dehydrogenase YdfG